jgi:DNA mismatch repair protein MSH2
MSANYYMVLGSYQEFLSYDDNVLDALTIFPSVYRPRIDSDMNGISSKGSSLYDLLNCCVSTLGSGMLRQWLQHPLVQRSDILSRQACVEFFVKASNTLLKLRTSKELLKGFPDVRKIGI